MPYGDWAQWKRRVKKQGNSYFQVRGRGAEDGKELSSWIMRHGEMGWTPTTAREAAEAQR